MIVNRQGTSNHEFARYKNPEGPGASGSASRSGFLAAAPADDGFGSGGGMGMGFAPPGGSFGGKGSPSPAPASGGGSSQRFDENGNAIPDMITEYAGPGGLVDSDGAGWGSDGGGWGGGGITGSGWGGGGWGGGTTKLGGGMSGAMHYAQGGAIDEATGEVAPMGAPRGNFGAQLAAATKSVQDALTYGRRKFGIMGQQEQQEAGLQRMPVAPGTQSESGKREQPAPGPLPPTSNPFGKRAEADEEAIPTGDGEDDEEMA